MTYGQIAYNAFRMHNGPHPLTEWENLTSLEQQSWNIAANAAIEHFKSLTGMG